MDWTDGRSRNGIERVKASVGFKEQARWELSLTRSRPFGDDGWTAGTAKKLELEHTIRDEGGAHGEGSSSRKGTEH